MAKVLIKRFASPDEMHRNTHGEIDILKLGGAAVARSVFAPGWQWSRDVKPKTGTTSCTHTHALYVLSGNMHIAMDDGAEFDIGQGDCALIPPGHDAWTVGDKNCVLFDVPKVEQMKAGRVASQKHAGPRRVGA